MKARLLLLLLAACSSLPGAGGSSSSEPTCVSDLRYANREALQCGGEADKGLAIAPADLRALTLCDARLDDARRVGALPELRALTLFRTAGPPDLAVLGTLVHLEHLDLTGVKATSFDFLPRLRKLRTLRLRDSEFRDTALLASLVELESLDLTNTPVADLAPLARLRKLRRLSLHATDVVDLGPLASLTSLERLDVAVTGVTDLEPLRGLHGLREVYLDSTFIYDVAPLHGHGKLRRVSVSGVPLGFSQTHALEESVNGGRSEDTRLVADSAGHSHFGGSCPTRPDAANEPFRE
jgi:hypothetical protein